MNRFDYYKNVIESEVDKMISIITDDKLLQVKKLLNSHNKIVTIGAGRMGYSLKSFTMRLSHLGYNVYHLGDCNVPRVGLGDLVIIASSSGETETNKLYAQIAKDAGATILLFTCNKESTIAKLSNYVIELKNIESDQIMKSLPEHATYMLYDIISMYLAEDKIIKTVEYNHSILE